MRAARSLKYLSSLVRFRDSFPTVMPGTPLMNGFASLQDKKEMPANLFNQFILSGQLCESELLVAQSSHKTPTTQGAADTSDLSSNLGMIQLQSLESEENTALIKEFCSQNICEVFQGRGKRCCTEFFFFFRVVCLVL